MYKLHVSSILSVVFVSIELFNTKMFTHKLTNYTNLSCCVARKKKQNSQLNKRQHSPLSPFSTSTTFMNWDCCGLQLKSQMCCTKLVRHDGHLCRKFAAFFTFSLIVSIWKQIESLKLISLKFIQIDSINLAEIFHAISAQMHSGKMWSYSLKTYEFLRRYCKLCSTSSEF